MKTITMLPATILLSALLSGCYITTEYCYVDEYTPPDPLPYPPFDPPPHPPPRPRPPKSPDWPQPVIVPQPSPQPVQPYRPTITGRGPINGTTTSSSSYDRHDSQTGRGSSYQSSTRGSDRGNQSSTSNNIENSRVRDNNARGKR